MTDADKDLVERKLVEHFAPTGRPRARAALVGVEAPRTALAAIKLAGGDVESLERYVLLASVDFRDVVGPAESPRYLAAGPDAMHRPDAAELIEQDAVDHRRWIDEPGPYAGM